MLDKFLYGFVLFGIICGVGLLAEIIKRSAKKAKKSFLEYLIVFVVVAVLIFIASKIFN